MLGGVVDVADWNWLQVEVINDDSLVSGQVLDCVLESSSSASGPWSPQSTVELRNIEAGGARNPPFDVKGLYFVRIFGSASGVGLNARVMFLKGD